jgi:hypothetical protein
VLTTGQPKKVGSGGESVRANTIDLAEKAKGNLTRFFPPGEREIKTTLKPNQVLIPGDESRYFY